MADKVWTGASSGDINTAGNWSPAGKPTAGDNVFFQPGYTTVPSSNLDGLKTATITGALGTVIFSEGWGGAITSSYLQFTCTRLDVWSSARLYINLEASTCAPEVFNTALGANGTLGLYLKGSALSKIIVSGRSHVGLAYFGGETSSVTDAYVSGGGAKLYLGAGVTNTNSYAFDGGSLYQSCAGTLVTARDGSVWTLGAGAIGQLKVFGKGRAYPTSSGILTQLDIEDVESSVDGTGSAEPRQWSTVNWKRGALKVDRNVVTINTLAVGPASRLFSGKLT